MTDYEDEFMNQYEDEFMRQYGDAIRQYEEEQYEYQQEEKESSDDKYLMMKEYLNDLVCQEGGMDNMTEIESSFYHFLEADYEYDETIDAIPYEFNDNDLMTSAELSDYNLAKRLESMFEACSEELDNKRIGILERLRPKIENLTKFELMLLEIYGKQKFDDFAEKMLAEDQKEQIVCYVRELFV